MLTSRRLLLVAFAIAFMFAICHYIAERLPPRKNAEADRLRAILVQRDQEINYLSRRLEATAIELRYARAQTRQSEAGTPGPSSVESGR